VDHPCGAEQSGKDVPVQCDGQRAYENFVVSWSAKSAIVYVRNPAFIDSEQRSSDQFRLGVSVGGNIDAIRGREETYYHSMMKELKL